MAEYYEYGLIGLFAVCFVGDIFALALGLVRYSQILCVLGIALGKMARYALLVVPFVL